MKTLISAETIRQAKAGGQTCLAAGKDVLVTPEARSLADELGIRLDDSAGALMRGDLAHRHAERRGDRQLRGIDGDPVRLIGAQARHQKLPVGIGRPHRTVLQRHRHARRARIDHREGIIGERPKKEIGVQAIRGGDVVGVHTVYFMGPGERIEVTHHAHSRENFAQGALRAASWLPGQPGGKVYAMGDILKSRLK